MLDNPNFKHQFDIAPYIQRDSKGKRHWTNFMSGNFSWQHCMSRGQVSHAKVLIFVWYRMKFIPQTIVYMVLCTSLSYWEVTRQRSPLWQAMSSTTHYIFLLEMCTTLCIVHIAMRLFHWLSCNSKGWSRWYAASWRTHSNKLCILAERKYDRDYEFRTFKWQLFHASISAILQPLKYAMTKPVVHRCPDGHYRHIIYDLGPFIADYPEQVMLARIVQGWCAK